MLLLPSKLDKFLPLLPSSRRELERRRRKAKEEELIQDTDHMMEIILPLCISRPNVYFYLSETLSKWILNIEKIDNASDLETILSSIQPYDDDESIDSTIGDNNSLHQQTRHSVSFATQIEEEEEERYSYPMIIRRRQQQQYEQCSAVNVDSWESLRQTKRNKPCNMITNISFLEDKIGIKDISKKFLIQGQINQHVSTTSNTIEEMQFDLKFLRQKVYNVAAEKCSSRIRNIINSLIQRLESDIQCYNSIRNNKDQRFQKEWNNEKDLFLQLLNYLEACIILVKKQQIKTNDTSASLYEDITTNSNFTDEEHYPYAHVYNQILSQYLAHTRTSSREDEQSDHYRWKRPERPTSESRWKDVEMVEKLVSIITSLEIQMEKDSPNFVAASTRVLAALTSLREDCITDAQRITQIEQRAMGRVKKRNNHTRACMSFATLSQEEKQQLLGSQVLVDIDF